MPHHSNSSEPPPAARLLPLATGHWIAAAVYCAAELGLADQIAAGTRTTRGLAEAGGLYEPSVYRLLRALASVGVVSESGPREFVLTPVGELLRSDHPGSMRASILFQGSPTHWKGWGNLIHNIRTGESAFEHAHGQPFFEYCKAHPDFGARFNDAMSSGTGALSRAVAEAYDFSTIRALVDVGGGQGNLLRSVLERFDRVRGVLIDLPEVVDGVDLGPELASRIDVVAGDFFTEVPAGDAYIMKNIIHDWDDGRAAEILKVVGRAADPGARLLIVEAIVGDGDGPSFAKILDLEMMHATSGGRQRTEAEFVELLRRTGFELRRIIPTSSMASIVEAVAV